jgi:radical SAM superfamily enzyme YgiQ (UPF0313 family)
MKNNYTVLFIAMSGVRVKDDELLRLGMTLPGFVERSEVIASLPSLSLLTLAAHNLGNWDSRYIDVDEVTDNVKKELLAIDADLIAISTFTARAYDTYNLSDYLMKSGACVVLGGLHVSVLPNEAKSHANAIVVGQAEIVWPNLLRDYESGNLQKIYNQSEYQSYSIKNSKIPRYDLIDISKYNRITIQTSRGCPLNCTFCAASKLISPYQLKPIDHIERELETIFKIWNRPFIELADDNTFVNKKWSKDLLRLFRKYPMKWFTESDISIADDTELLELLAESNCAQVLIGLESASPESLSGIEANDWKRRQFDSYMEKIEKIQSYGISVNGCFILGLDSDELSSFEITDQFIKDSNLSEVQITILTPFPGTVLYDKLKAENRLLKDIFWDECTLFDVTFHPKNFSSDELRDGFHRLMRSVYSDERVAQRKRIFKNCRKNRIRNIEV